MDLSRVPELNKQAVIDALPNMTSRFTDETLRECAQNRDLQGAVDRVQELCDENTNMAPEQRMALFAAGDAHFLDCVMASVLLVGISKMLSV